LDKGFPNQSANNLARNTNVTRELLFEKRNIEKNSIHGCCHFLYCPINNIFYLDKLILRQVSTKLHQGLYLLKIQQAM